MDLVLLGAPGSGKGTLAARLAPALGMPHVSTGDIFRKAMADGTPLGNSIRQGMDEGRLVPDDTTVAIVADRIAQPDLAGGFMLDGFPRTLPQAEAFEGVLASQDRQLRRVLLLAVSDATVTARLLGRRQCRACGSICGLDSPPRAGGRCDACGGELYVRGDDNADSVSRRLATFHAETEPLSGFYAARGILSTLAAEGSPDSILAAALASL